MEGEAGWQRDGVVVIWVAGAELVASDREPARLTAKLMQRTQHLGLTIADRACLARARVMGGRVLTADRCWAGIS